MNFPLTVALVAVSGCSRRSAEKAGTARQRLLGRFHRNSGSYNHVGGVPGATVIADSGTVRQTVTTDANGNYSLSGLPPNRYQIEVAKDGYAPDLEFNHRWSGFLVLNKETSVLEPEKGKEGSVVLPAESCEVWDLAMWPDGRFSGTVRDRDGKSVSGVEVQAFEFDEKGERASRPIRTAVTDGTGVYVLGSLPGGNYVIGVNAETYRDEIAYPPTLYGAGKVLHLADSQRVGEINLVLPPQRTAAMMRVRVLGLDGAPAPDALVVLENEAGIQRWHSNEQTDARGYLNVSAFIGEKYVVKATLFGARGKEHSDFDYLEGTTLVIVAHEHSSADVVLSRHFFERDK
jgi:hypothetical protein